MKINTFNKRMLRTNLDATLLNGFFLIIMILLMALLGRGIDNTILNMIIIFIPLLFLVRGISLISSLGFSKMYYYFLEDDSHDKKRLYVLLHSSIILMLIISIIVCLLYNFFIKNYIGLFYDGLEDNNYINILVNSFSYIFTIMPLLELSKNILNVIDKKKYRLLSYIGMILLILSTCILNGISSFTGVMLGIIITMFVIILLSLIIIINSKKHTCDDKEYSIFKSIKNLFTNKINIKMIYKVLKIGILESRRELFDGIFLYLVILFGIKKYLLDYRIIFFVMLFMYMYKILIVAFTKKAQSLIHTYKFEFNYLGIIKAFKTQIYLLLKEIIIFDLICYIVLNFMERRDTIIAQELFGHKYVILIMIGSLLLNMFIEIFITYFNEMRKLNLSLSLDVLNKFIIPLMFLLVVFNKNISIEIYSLVFILSPLVSIIILEIILLLRKLIMKDNLTIHLLLDKNNSDIISYDLLLDTDEHIVDVKDNIIDTLKNKNIDGKKVNVIALLFEDLSLLIKEKNNLKGNKKVYSEITILLRQDSIRIIFKDDGVDVRPFDVDGDVDSLRQYIVSELLIDKLRKEQVEHDEFNRNIVELR